MQDNLSDSVRQKLVDEEFNSIRSKFKLSPQQGETKTDVTRVSSDPSSLKNPITDGNEDSGFWGTLRAGARDIGKGLMESPKQIIGGARDMAQDFTEIVYTGGQAVSNKMESWGVPKSVTRGRLIYDHGTWRFGTDIPDMPVLPEVSKSTSKTGGMIRGISEFVSAMGPVGKGLKMAGMSKGVVKSALSGAGADLIITSEGDQRLADLTKQYPKLNKFVPSFLESNPDDTLAETKVKSAIEGLGIGVAGDSLLHGLRVLKASKMAPSVGQLAIDEGLKNLAEPLDGFLMAAKSAAKTVPESVQLKLHPNIDILENLPDRIREMRADGKLTAEIVNEMELSARNAILGITGVTKEYVPDIAGEITKLSSKVEKALNKTQSGLGEWASNANRSIAHENKMQELTGNPNLPLVDTAGNINLSHISTDEDIKRIITEFASDPDIKSASRGIQTHKMTEELAEKLNMSVEELLSRRPGEAKNAEWLYSARSILTTSTEKVRELAKLLDQGEGGITEVAFGQQLLLNKAIQAEISGATTEAGRALNQFNMDVKSTKGSTKAIEEIIRTFNKGEVGIQKIAASINIMDDPAQVHKFLSQVDKMSSLEVFSQIRTACLLTSPKTHVVNMISNGLNGIWQIPERMLAAHMKPKNPGELVQKGEWTAMAYGSVNGLVDAIRLAGKKEFLNPTSLGKEIPQSTYSRQISKETYPALGVVSDYLGKAINIPFKALCIEDEFFKTIAYRAELHAQAFRKASSEGLKGDEFAKRMSSFLDNPDDIMKGRSKDFAKYVTFQQELEGMMKGAAQAVNSSPWMRLVVPFVKTPSNIILETIERTPLAPLTQRYKKAIEAGGSEAQIAMARHKLGTGVSAICGTLLASGYMSGGGPLDKGERTGKMSTGWQPYSFKVGDKWISYNRLEPISGILALAADGVSAASNVVDAKEADEIVVGLGLVLGHYLEDRTYFKGIADMLDAVFSPNRGKNLMEMAVKIGTSAVPPGQFGVWAAQQVEDVKGDPLMRDAREWLDQILIKIPGLSDKVPPRRDVWGNPIKVKSAIGPDALSPLVYSEEKGDKLSKMLIDNNIEISVPRRVIDFGGHGEEGIPLNSDEYDKFSELSGKGAKKYLDSIISDLSKAPKELQQLTINNVLSGYRKMAKHQILDMFPSLHEQVENRRKEYRDSLER